jgi:hypothetical protein
VRVVVVQDLAQVWTVLVGAVAVVEHELLLT